MGRLEREEVAREWEAQMQRVTRSGISPTHIDSHHHLHLLPGLLPLAVQCAHNYDVPWLRRPAESHLARDPFPVRAGQASHLPNPGAQALAASHQ